MEQVPQPETQSHPLANIRFLNHAFFFLQLPNSSFKQLIFQTSFDIKKHFFFKFFFK